MTGKMTRPLTRGELKPLAQLMDQLALAEWFAGEALEGVPTGGTHPARVSTIDTEFEPVSQLASLLRFADLFLPPVTDLVPYGSDPAQWLPRP